MEVLQLKCLSLNLIQWDIPNHPLDASFVSSIKCYSEYEKQIPDGIIGHLIWFVASYDGMQVKRENSSNNT